MAWSIVRSAEKTLHLLKQNGLELEGDEANSLLQHGHAQMFGFNCKVANVVGTNSFRVRVCSEWFQSFSVAKPRIRTSPVEFDYQLLPTRKYLFALYYLALRDYACQLEMERDRWFREPNWGLVVDEERGLFTWKEGNTLRFPLLVLSSPLDLDLRAKQYHAQPVT
ncbi:hypothetical protein LCGC14_1729520 [marine sediment metagenome]|uniref:Uncharacterized protein n=1 Tax=marine sediment metagenome TaxID=412755 RepID=A0A0F9JQL0_9ZZZZ